MLNEYPIYFGSTALDFFPSTWDETYNVSENVFETEAGTDQVHLIRAGKLHVSVSFRRTSDSAKFFKQFSLMDSFALRIYDAIEEDYISHTVRMRNFRMSLVPKTENIPVTNGLWNISFDLEEF